MKIKEEKGSIAIMVIVTMLIMVGVLTSIYMSLSNKYDTQTQITRQIKEIYEKDIGNLDDVYETYQEESSYINNKEELKNFIERLNSGITFEGKTVFLMADIDLNENNYTIGSNNVITFEDNAEEWTPIGTDTNTFKGTFDGNGHTIKGIYCNKADTDYIGLFSKNEGTIKNLTIENSTLIGKNYVGGIVGENKGTIENCVNKASVSGNTNIGGIVAIEEGNIIGCENNGNITSKNSYIGGICAELKENSKITNCKNTGTIGVESGQFVGGIVGNTNANTIVSNCINTGNIDATASWSTGGIVGNNKGKISLCANKGNIETGENSGTAAGIAGYNDKSIENCYNTGNISGYKWVAGITGASNPKEEADEEYYVKNCYNVGNITGNSYVGAIMGTCDINYIENCFYLDSSCKYGIEVDRTVKKGENWCVSKTSDELKEIYSTLGEYWEQDTKNENSGYPVFKENITSNFDV